MTQKFVLYSIIIVSRKPEGVDAAQQQQKQIKLYRGRLMLIGHAGAGKLRIYTMCLIF